MAIHLCNLIKRQKHEENSSAGAQHPHSNHSKDPTSGLLDPPPVCSKTRLEERRSPGSSDPNAAEAGASVTLGRGGLFSLSIVRKVFLNTVTFSGPVAALIVSF